MEKFLITAMVIAVPTYFYAWLVRSIDRFEKEPLGYLVWAFFWGAVPSIIGGIILQGMLSVPVEEVLGASTVAGAFAMAAIAAPVTEEVLKAIAVAVVYFTRRQEFDGWVDGIVYGATAGFGFAYVENILYLVNKTETLGQWVVLFFVRVIALGFMHGFWTALTGIGFGFARYMHNPLSKVFVITAGLLAAIAGHLIHNGSLVLADATESSEPIMVALVNYLFLGGMLIVLWFVASFRGRSLMRTYLHDEVPGVLSAEDYKVVSGRKDGRMSRQRRRALTQAAAELAQKKFQLQKMGDEGVNSSEIDRIRTKLRQISLG
ncbi:MAG: PrsW family intramembrane metalloprotease [Cyanobacteria bacterium]|nr:PrsW family intramembrane metalloprotease [Cyanobacteriota bacterium]MDW8200299.1 PrsW family intramembrane metalloprotease [Cyanobacteriota bacterium SKYGB_h_bin112]